MTRGCLSIDYFFLTNKGFYFSVRSTSYTGGHNSLMDIVIKIVLIALAPIQLRQKKPLYLTKHDKPLVLKLTVQVCRKFNI